MKKDIVIFDFDNTVVSSLDYWHNVIDRLMFKKYGLKVNKNMRKRRLLGLSNREMAQTFAGLSNRDMTEEQVFEAWGEFMEYYYTKKIKPLNGVKEFLNRLKEQGKKIYVASATEEPLLKIAIKHFGFDFDGVFTETTIGYIKKNPKFYETLLNKLGVEPIQVFLFEDSAGSLQSATSLGIDTCAIIHKLNKKHSSELKFICKAMIKDYKDKKLKNLFD